MVHHFSLDMSLLAYQQGCQGEKMPHGLSRLVALLIVFPTEYPELPPIGFYLWTYFTLISEVLSGTDD
jgi:hypothetical protein